MFSHATRSNEADATAHVGSACGALSAAQPDFALRMLVDCMRNFFGAPFGFQNPTLNR